MTVDKRVSNEAAIAAVGSGDSILIGGWGDVRKPMSLVRAIARSDVANLTIYSYAAMDLDLLIGAGKVRKAVFGFVACDGGAPIRAGNVIRARREATVDMREMDEYMFCCQFKAAAERIPFYPVRAGIGTDILTLNPELRTVHDPYSDETVLAVPAFSPDLCLIHANAADRTGNARISGDPFWDRVFAKAGKHVVVSCERIVPVGEIGEADILGIHVDQVVEAPGAAAPGSCYPDYAFDAQACLEYGKAARNPDDFASYLAHALN